LLLYSLLISFALTIFYVSILWAYKNEWEDIQETGEQPATGSVTISIIIPARNEAKNIFNILHDISEQNYPAELFEVIVIDDHSDDETYAISSTFAKRHPHFKTLKLSVLTEVNGTETAYKKRAIEAAVKSATGTLIITTDADCRVQKTWLQHIAAFYEKENGKLIAAPVCFYGVGGRFQQFQALDFCGMQVITGASLSMGMFNMANGANLAYEKEAFLKVNGYQDIDKKASGDDMLLVYKIAQQYPEQVKFLKDKLAVVYTRPTETLSEFLQQRFRWTSKSRSYQDKRITAILGLVYLFVLSIWVNALYFIGKLIYSSIFPDRTLEGFLNFLPALILLLMTIFQIICKSIIDYYFLKSASTFFRRQDLMKSFFTSELLHIWYIPFVGTFGNILQYKWKGRKLN
jgi:biofilm PGA synthesis N-glycosyltransferase PgaC